MGIRRERESSAEPSCSGVPSSVDDSPRFGAEECTATQWAGKADGESGPDQITRMLTASKPTAFAAAWSAGCIKASCSGSLHF